MVSYCIACVECEAALACVTNVVDMIYQCNDCRRVIVQLDMFDSHNMASAYLPGEFRLHTEMVQHCPGRKDYLRVQNKFMMCRECGCGLP